MKPTTTERIKYQVLSPIQRFTRLEAAAGILLVLATVAAMVWANSPWQSSYFELWNTELSVAIGSFGLSKPLLLWVNDGLMAVFFFLVGLEIKRELLVGELSSFKQAVMPVSAAMGGMVVPAAVFLILVKGSIGAEGWGIPMATDIAFALGIMKLLGKRVPLGLKVFLTALAIIDDIGAVLIIAFFYSEELVLQPFLWVGIGFVYLILLNLFRFRWPLLYLVGGAFMWYGMLKGGIHPTIAGVLSAFCIPVHPKFNIGELIGKVEFLLGKMREQSFPDRRSILPTNQLHAVENLTMHADEALPPLQRLEYRLHDVVMFVIMPVFALANAGIVLPTDIIGALTAPVTYGVVGGLFIGKAVGVLGMSWLSTKLGLAKLPPGTTWMQILSLGFLAGVGFTMSLFIANLAYVDQELIAEAKIGILLGSLLSGCVGAFILYRSTSPPEPPNNSLSNDSHTTPE